MADITRTKASVSQVAGPSGYRVAAGEALEAGQVIYIDGTNGAKKADASAAATAKAAGLAIAGSEISAGSIASGDTFDVAGPGAIVGGFSGMTPGDLLYVSDTAGALADAAGTKSKPVARAITATELMVTLEGVDPA
jgi:hypothetical protein